MNKLPLVACLLLGACCGPDVEKDHGIIQGADVRTSSWNAPDWQIIKTDTSVITINMGDDVWIQNVSIGKHLVSITNKCGRRFEMRQ